MVAFPAREAARLPNGEALGMHCLASLYNCRVRGPRHALLREHNLVFLQPDARATREFVALAALEGVLLDVLCGIPSSDGPKLLVPRLLNPVLQPNYHLEFTNKRTARACQMRPRNECDYISLQVTIFRSSSEELRAPA
ncbi:putative cis-zeatin O-glucosyltransferase [Panicum miliaceum]|uniref:Cis-zeatin O-glucosyltransferase n=1 Tax=Panicum miliaceum TaxID=4540 RepID=A0A3L6RR73_PANMI|nr:putative cis-zeatin O-glucosyltransferase [Panicum miliaceum]